ncbi:MAG: oligosaccharide flippase family protein [Rikenellaceae bacterium]
MSENSANNKRVAKNTILLYFRTIVVMVVSLYTSRVVLQNLGVDDFGIYSVVGGVTAMFGLISGGLSLSVTKFLNIEMSKPGEKDLNKVFSTSVTIHIALAVIFFILAELVGPWFINNKLVISADRLQAANLVFHCSIITFAINLLSVPYNACIIANENMKIFAYVSILEVILKLSVAFALTLFLFDKLILYGILMLSVSIIIRVVYQIYCRRNYKESKYTFVFDKVLAKQMFGFAGWSFIGSSSVLLSNQGINVLLNMFQGPAVNAARAIAVQVNGAVTAFVTNFTTALNPQITKSYGAKDLDRFKMLMINGSRLAFALLIIITTPLIIKGHVVLRLWLGEVPNHTFAFVQLILLSAISESMSLTFTTGLLSTESVRKVQILVGGCRLLNLPLSYVALYLWGIPEITMVIYIVISQINLFIEIYLLKEFVSFSISRYVKTIYLKHISILFLSLFTTYIFNLFVADSVGGLALTTLFSIIISVLSIMAIGCSKQERVFIYQNMKSKIFKR